ncbi:TPA: hypothetical protein ACSP7Z_002813 [Serratia fonticola]
MDQTFLLTYSVRTVTKNQSDKDKADKVRNKIANIDEWVKQSPVETTFTGKMYITGDTDQAKKKTAIKNVQAIFLPILEEFEAKADKVVIDCVLSVNNIKEAFDFEIKN